MAKKANIDSNYRPFSMMASFSLPLAPSSFQVWKKPYFMSHGNGSGAPSSSSSSSSCAATKPYSSSTPPLSDANKITTHNDDDKTTQSHPSPPSDDKDHHHDQIPSSGDDSVKTVPGNRTAAGGYTRWSRKLDQNMEPKKLRRIMSNRVSAQRCRLKKIQYVTDMERKAKALEAQIATLHPQLEVYRNQHEFLLREQRSLNQRMITFTTNSIIINAEIEENKAEVNRLRQLHLSQQQKVQGHEIERMPVCESGFEQMTSSNLSRAALGKIVNTNPNQGQYGMNTEELMNMQKQLKMKEVVVQFDDKLAETNRLMLDRETGRAEQMPNRSSISSGPPEKANINLINSNLGGVGQILSLNNNVFQNSW